ncbi:MAG: TRL-like family protein [Campylobacterales bacterium]|nr:TRL-like family protein [Campylobacterales bacterium]
MKKTMIIAMLGALLLTGCVHRATTPHMSYPVQEADFMKHTKTGEACKTFFVSMFGSDISVRKAAENGGVNQVKYVEIKSNPFQHCVVVYGN